MTGTRPSQWIGDTAETLTMIWERFFGDVADVPDASPSCPRRCWDVPVTYYDMETRLRGFLLTCGVLGNKCEFHDVCKYCLDIKFYTVNTTSIVLFCAVLLSSKGPTNSYHTPPSQRNNK